MFKNIFRRSAPGPENANTLPSPDPLLKAMHAVALSDTKENRGILYREFLKAWLWFCVPELPDGWKPGMTALLPGMNIPIITPNNSKGEKVLPVFTDQPALANYDPNTPNMACIAVEVFKIAVKLPVSQILINPFDPVRKPMRTGGTLMRNEFTALAQGMIPEPTPDGKGQTLTVQRPTQVQIGRNKLAITPEVKSRLVVAAEGLPEVDKIFRYRMRFVDTGVESEVFGLVCSATGDRFHQIVTSLMTSVQPLVGKGNYVDFTKLDQSKLQLMQTHGELVFDRSGPNVPG